MRTIITLLLCCFHSIFYAQSVTENDIKKLAAEVNSQIKGMEFDGMTGRGCYALGRTIFYQYDIPEGWVFPENMKEGIIANMKTAGLSKMYFLNDVNIIYYYYNGNSLEKKISIKSHELSPYNFELGDHLSLNDHPKAKDVNMKLRYPVGWEVQEGDRPNVVKKFVDESNIFLVLIRDNTTFFSRSEAELILTDKAFAEEIIAEFSSIMEDPEVIDQKLVTVDTYPALEFTIKGNIEKLGYNLEMILTSWMILYEDKVVTFQATGMGEKEFQSLKGLYTQIINSVVFPDQYK